MRQLLSAGEKKQLKRLGVLCDINIINYLGIGRHLIACVCEEEVSLKNHFNDRERTAGEDQRLSQEVTDSVRKERKRERENAMKQGEQRNW